MNTTENTTDTRRPRIVIIGAGPGGLCMGIRLRAAGIEDFVILEKATGAGGTWWHNRYPGAECDVPSHLYSFSFEPKRDWSRPYARQPEILAYMEEVAERYGMYPFIRFGTEVRSARWDERDASWTVETAEGETIAARVLVSAMGMFNEPAYPDIPGLETFSGECFHSARWNHDHDLAGARVAVIGSAASAVQFVPEIAPAVGALDLYQRSANWVLPKEDEPYSEANLERFRREPSVTAAMRQEIQDQLDGFITFSDPKALQAAEAAGLEHLAVVEDPEVRRQLVPTHPFGCKRPLASNLYYPVFNEPHVRLITTGIAEVTERGVVTLDGVERAADTLILATGFHTGQYLSAIDVTGRGGRPLDEAWREGAQAWLGMTTAGFPNLFMLYGPNTNNGSILYMLELQVDYILRQIRRLDDEGLAWVDVKPEVMDRYNEALQHDIDQVAVWQGACNGYYRAASGRVVTQWPHTMAEYERRTRDAAEAAGAAFESAGR
jgi:cation diffusion facilitator CzcD-associated flavoprotein CzcO